MTDVNILDKIISWFSPRAGAERIAWRLSQRNYDAGGFGRINNNWHAANMPGEATDAGYRDIIRARARDLERNADTFESIIRAWVRNVVGDGYRLQAQTPDAELNLAIEALWKQWQRPRNCDALGQLSLTEMVRMIVRRMRVDGGILILKVNTPGGVVPLALQLLEVDRLDTTVMDYGGNAVIGGVEINQYGKPVAYHIKSINQFGLETGERQRIDAQRIIYLANRTRPSQVREMSPSANIIERIRDINEYIEAVSIKERVAACLSVFVKKVSPSSFGRMNEQPADPATGYDTTTLAPGTIRNLQPGEDIQVVSPPNTASNAAEMLRTQQRMAGSGQGLSYEAVSRDMSQVNYSSARQGLLEDIREYRVEQQYLIDHFYYEIYTEFLISAVVSGALPIDQGEFWGNKADYIAHTFIPSGWSWIDPLKEANANQVALNTGQTTLARICAGNGADWREELKQRAAEIEYARSLGIELAGGQIQTVDTGGNNA